MASMELGEGVRIEIPRDVLKEMVESNPTPEAALESCMKGPWAESWSSGVTGITAEEAEKTPALKEIRERAKRLLCTKLLEALKK